MRAKIEEQHAIVENLRAEENKLWAEFQETELKAKPYRERWYHAHEKRQQAECKLNALREIAEGGL